MFAMYATGLAPCMTVVAQVFLRGIVTARAMSLMLLVFVEAIVWLIQTTMAFVTMLTIVLDRLMLSAYAAATARRMLMMMVSAMMLMIV